MKAIKKTSTQIQLFIDKFTFLRILSVWLGIISLFGLLYYFLPTTSSYLFITKTGVPTTSFYESMYFSFITATTTGFGDISPLGFFRLIAIIEVILGLLVLAVVTSKLVSLKQNTIIEELYEITLTERINRVRSRLLYLRQNMSDYIHRIEEGAVQKRDIKQLYQFFQQFKDTSDEITLMFSRLRKSETTGQVTEVHAGLIVNSCIDTLSRIQEVIETLMQQNVSWQLEKNELYLKRALESNANVFKQIRKGKLLQSETLEIREKEKEKIEEQIKLLLSK
jgi:hypothetical protein